MIAAPTLGDLGMALARAVGPERGGVLFRDAIATVGVESESEVPVARVLDVARVIQRRDGLVSLVGLSYAIRCETYLVLSREAVDG